MFKSLIIASMFVGTVASAKVEVGVGVGVKPIQDYTNYYARQCVKSVRQAIQFNGGKVTYSEVVYASGKQTSVYAEYVTENCYGYICYNEKKTSTFGCYEGRH